jgi:hypothetical protein
MCPESEKIGETPHTLNGAEGVTFHIYSRVGLGLQEYDNT